MMRSRSLYVFLFALLIASGRAQNGGTPARYEFVGYLADMLCTRLEIAPDMANMIRTPEDHTVRCELLPACLRSGYGITQDIGTGSEREYRVSASFDESGNNYVADLLRAMPNEVNDLKVRVKGTFQAVNPPAMTPSISSRDGERFWPALNGVPIISVDSLEFCNYQGPDSFMDVPDACSTDNLLKALSGDKADLVAAGLCLREELTVNSDDADYFIVSTDGCADHATFRDVKRADAETCNPPNPECEETGCTGSTCDMQCIDACGNPLLKDGTSNKRARACCLDACGNPLVDGCGFPFYDPCGNPAMNYAGDACPAARIGENDLNECTDACGNPLADACGNPLMHCCLDGCGSPLVDACGNPFLDACGNPARDAQGTACPAADVGMNMCDQSACEESTCELECIDACGNPLLKDGTSNRHAKACCLDACGNPLIDGCGFPFYDPCGNPAMNYAGDACPPANIGENEINECTDACGNPLADACGNPLEHCCLDACGSPLVDACGNPFLDACGNPARDAQGTACPAAQVGMNHCESGSEGSAGAGAAWRRDGHEKEGGIEWAPANSGGGGSCSQQCIDACGNPLLKDGTSNRHAKACCLDACGNPLVDGCGFPFYDPCGNPTMNYAGDACPPANIGENEINECTDACGNPLADACGNPLEHCCLDACGSPLVDACGNPFLDACGNPARDAQGTACPAADVGGNVCPEGEGEEGGSCSQQCIDACGNPLLKDGTSNRHAKACCLDACGNPLVDGCGFPFYDPCGNPAMNYAGDACPAARIGENEINECTDACGNPLADACGNPLMHCCLDACGSPLVDACGNPFLDACGNPARDAQGTACPAVDVGANECPIGEAGPDCSGAAAAMPPAADAIECEGLVSACRIAMEGMPGEGDAVDGVPTAQRRRGLGGKPRAAPRKTAKRTAKKATAARRAGEPSVPRYTPLKRDYQVKIPKATVPRGSRARKELTGAHEGVVGVAINGVPIVHEHPGDGDMTMLFDGCGGHGDLDNRYHYHIAPVCLIRMLGGTVPRASDWWLAPHPESQWPQRALGAEKSPLLGWALDGHPIFGPYNPDNGELVVPQGAAGDECAANQLDECNGMELENGEYAYFLTPTFPFVPPCLMGAVAPDAFVDRGLKNGEVAQCPFEGTHPLAGHTVCEEKPLVFSDESCPGSAPRQAIRTCFEAALSAVLGEPSCADLAAAQGCFTDRGCCHDWDATLAEYAQTYPALGACAARSSCPVFGADNVVSMAITVHETLQGFSPDRQATFRAVVAEQLAVPLANVRIAHISDAAARRAAQLRVSTEIAAEDAAAATALQAAIDADAVSAALTAALEVEVAAEAPILATPPPPPPAPPALWESKEVVGLAFGCAGVLVLFAALCYFEDVLCAPTREPEGGKLAGIENPAPAFGAGPVLVTAPGDAKDSAVQVGGRHFGAGATISAEFCVEEGRA